jgi:hypothetical protein
LSANGTLSKIVPSHVLSNVPLSSADEFTSFLDNLPVSSSCLRLRAHLFQPRASPGFACEISWHKLRSDPFLIP